ncbi:anthranilate synthase component I [Thermincola potens]|uniref:Anthranilate synthase component 1 n=1 Tax=Thermincola potens (strain JR) TaxID=635013 RepID=D5X789_THEPJ|nr:anthranilate synthase component I [Thermincola potens]ADG82459.1 anthranilate synthase component I [Thermincola potens JR]
MIYPSENDYLQMAEEYNLIPVHTEVVVDTDTPITVYAKACQGKQGFLLESVEGGENLARYSFIGFEPVITFTSKKGAGKIIEGDYIYEFSGSPLAELEKLTQRFNAPKLTDLPRFYGGAVGYFGYDTVRFFEKLPDCNMDDLDLPECHFIITRFVLAFDHITHKLKIICNTMPGKDSRLQYMQAVKDLEIIRKKILQHNISVLSRGSTPEQRGDIKSNLPKRKFLEMVNKAKEYIKAGDIFQVVLSQRFSLPLNTDPFSLYRTLRVINPAPYLYFLDFGEIQIIGSSPEMLVRVEDGIVQTCPIAGTRPRGVTPEEDRALEQELLQDEKELAEHLMLVDLGRNDLGRVCEYGSIEVPDFMVVQRYSHVMHLVSSVKGRLAEGKTAFAALQACFPAGTLSGAPKVRAMEIIEELEPTKRGLYGGAIGYLSFTGNMDTCITIRTILVHRGMVHIQAGAGIVADSDPEREYQETLNKARALIETLAFREVG